MIFRITHSGTTVFLPVLQASRLIAGSTSAAAVSGTLTFGEEGTIVLPVTWNGEMGRFKVISAASLAGVANLKNWRVEADLNGHRYIAKLIADGTDVYVEILGEGTMIFVR